MQKRQQEFLESFVDPIMDSLRLKTVIMQNSQSHTKTDLDLSQLSVLGSLGHFEFEVVVLDQDSALDQSDLYHTRFQVSRNIKLTIESHVFQVPRSEFIVSDYLTLPLLFQDLEKFDFVVLDPPWPNASVKRSKIYKEMDVFDLYQLPLPSILAQDAIVCLWVTNKLKYHELAKKLFKKWRLHLYKQIIWIKMKDGQLIFDIRSKHRKPFEICLVARTGPPATSVESVFLGASQTFHSQKPSLEYLFDLKDKKKLELFARRVVEDWTCWGNETLLFNAIEDPSTIHDLEQKQVPPV